MEGRFGVAGVGGAAAGRTAAASAVGGYFSSRLVTIPYAWGRIILTTAASGLTSAVCIFTPKLHPVFQALVNAGGILLFMAFLVLTKDPVVEEVRRRLRRRAS